MSVFDEYQTVIGIECHVQLNTASKLFSAAPNQFGSEPNSNIDGVDAGLPGSLPVLNRGAVQGAIKLGLALNCEIHRLSIFSRKHYFYPDLPKGYQISQFDKPICGPGLLQVAVDGKSKDIRIHRIHIEEDAGKNIHVEGGASSFVDYNRAGTPLLEVVTEPDMRSAEEAVAFVRSLRNLVTYLEICDGNLQEGSIRADVNVSVMKKGSAELGTRTETKNLNSFRFIGQAIEYEARRQVMELESGNLIAQETRLWDPNLKESRPMRSKEEAHDYRYFPDPDLPPLLISDGEIFDAEKHLPETPDKKRARFTEEGVSAYNAGVLTSDKALSDYFEEAISNHNNKKTVANWIINELMRVVKNHQSDSEYSDFASPINAQALAELVRLIDEGQISGKIAKGVFEAMCHDPSISPKAYVEERGLIVEKDEGVLQKIIENVCIENQDAVLKFQSGNGKVFGFLMGQVMKLSKGKASPKDATEMLRKKLRRDA